MKHELELDIKMPSNLRICATSNARCAGKMALHQMMPAVRKSAWSLAIVEANCWNEMAFQFGDRKSQRKAILENWRKEFDINWLLDSTNIVLTLDATALRWRGRRQMTSYGRLRRSWEERMPLCQIQFCLFWREVISSTDLGAAAVIPGCWINARSLKIRWSSGAPS